MSALCNASEQCSSDILKKLRQWGISSADASAIIDSLISSRLIDDSRFAELYARHKLLYNGWGRRKIVAGLYSKHIDKEFIKRAVEILDKEEYYEVLLKILRSAARKQPDRSYESKMKIMRHAAARGFEAGLIVEIIKSGELWESSKE